MPKSHPQKRRSLRDRFWAFVARHLVPYLYDTPYLYGPKERFHIGQHVGMSNAMLNARSGSITLEDYVMLGNNVALLTGIHDYTRPSPHRRTITDAKRDIVIERGAWVCSNAIVIGPVHIGAESVVASGSVVTKDVPPHTLVAGNPARVLRQLVFAEDAPPTATPVPENPL